MTDGLASIEDFHALDIRVGRVLRVEPNMRARVPAYIVDVDLGDDLGVRTSSAQITEAYTPESLEGRLVLALVNIPPRRVAGVRSEVLVLGVYSEKGDGPVVLIGPDEHDRVRPGDRVG
ncbi:MAG: tRNA-binding protein [Phycisphaeraceae bacterium]|nr:MAG: tRNA-binding protein [Phycisphaeraceae bacterium]